MDDKPVKPFFDYQWLLLIPIALVVVAIVGGIWYLYNPFVAPIQEEYAVQAELLEIDHPNIDVINIEYDEENDAVVVWIISFIDARDNPEEGPSFSRASQDMFQGRSVVISILLLARYGVEACPIGELECQFFPVDPIPMVEIAKAPYLGR